MDIMVVQYFKDKLKFMIFPHCISEILKHYLTVREPTLPVAPATKTRFSSFELMSCGIASTATEDDLVATCGIALKIITLINRNR